MLRGGNWAVLFVAFLDLRSFILRFSAKFWKGVKWGVRWSRGRGMFFAHHSLNEEVITEAADVGAVESLHLISELLVSFPLWSLIFSVVQISKIVDLIPIFALSVCFSGGGAQWFFSPGLSSKRAASIAIRIHPSFPLSRCPASTVRKSPFLPPFVPRRTLLSSVFFALCSTVAVQKRVSRFRIAFPRSKNQNYSDPSDLLATLAAVPAFPKEARTKPETLLRRAKRAVGGGESREAQVQEWVSNNSLLVACLRRTGWLRTLTLIGGVVVGIRTRLAINRLTYHNAPVETKPALKAKPQYSYPSILIFLICNSSAVVAKAKGKLG